MDVPKKGKNRNGATHSTTIANAIAVSSISSQQQPRLLTRDCTLSNTCFNFFLSLDMKVSFSSSSSSKGTWPIGLVECGSWLEYFRSYRRHRWLDGWWLPALCCWGRLRLPRPRCRGERRPHLSPWRRFGMRDETCTIAQCVRTITLKQTRMMQCI